MSKLMSVLGIVLLAFGVALALMGFVNGARLQILGITMDTAATLIVGGILSIGLGGVIQAIYDRMGGSVRVVDEQPMPAPAPAPQPIAIEPAPAPTPVVVVAAKEQEPPARPPQIQSRLRFPGFKKVEAATVAATAATATVADAMTPSVQETIEALEKAKEELSQSVGGIAEPVVEVPEPVIAPPPPAFPPVQAEVIVEEPEVEDIAEEETGGELFVVEDRVIRGRPARVLSDGTVEAETDEGWMRFENLEHLNEYLDSVQPEE